MATLRSRIQILQELGYCEDEITEVLSISHKRYRATVGSSGVMTYGAAQELLAEDDDITRAKAAEIYQVPISEIDRAKRGTVTKKYSQEALMWLVLRDNSPTVEALAAKAKRMFGEPISFIRSELAKLNMLKLPEKPDFAKPKIIEALEEGTMSRADIARAFDCRPSYVTAIAADLGMPKLQAKPAGLDWDAVLAYYDETQNKLQTSEKFGVSRAAITYQLKKRSCS